jgi:citrate synthase
MFRVAALLGEVVPDLLMKQGKVKSPYPNIDGISGTMLYLFGLQQLPFYTVMFSVAQSIGICAQLILMRGMLTPIFRPKSITTDMLKKQLGAE